jgi:hypothetical protein
MQSTSEQTIQPEALYSGLTRGTTALPKSPSYVNPGKSPVRSRGKSARQVLHLEERQSGTISETLPTEVSAHVNNEPCASDSHAFNSTSSDDNFQLVES